MGVWIAIRAFFQALRTPDRARTFLEPEQKKKKVKEDPSHLLLLRRLQQSGRLIDFLMEDISSFSDAQVGAAVRKVHEECNKSLEELVTVRPIMDEAEGSQVKVDPGFDPQKIRLVGNIEGKAPYLGVLRHRGWDAKKRSLAKGLEESVLCPAEVEV